MIQGTLEKPFVQENKDRMPFLQALFKFFDATDFPCHPPVPSCRCNQGGLETSLVRGIIDHFFKGLRACFDSREYQDGRQCSRPAAIPVLFKKHDVFDPDRVDHGVGFPGNIADRRGAARENGNDRHQQNRAK